MKEAIRMVPESIYDPEDTSHFRSGRGRLPITLKGNKALRRIKEEWGTSRWFLEFDISKCFHTIDRLLLLKLISIFKEEIDDPKFFDSMKKVFSLGRLVGGEKGPYPVPHSVLLSALLGNIYLHKLDQEIVRIRQKYEIPIEKRIRSVLLKTSLLDDQEKSVEEGSFNAYQDKRAIILTRLKSSKRKAAFHSLVPFITWHTLPTSTPRLRGDQKRPVVFPPDISGINNLATFLNKPSSLLFAAFLIEALGLTPKTEFYGREGFNKNLAMRDLFKYIKRKGLLIELGGAARLVIRSEKGLARKPAPLNSHYLIRICYARYADDLLLGIVGAVELLIEIQKRIAHFLQVGLNLWVGSAGSTTIAYQSTVEFLGTVIRTVPPKTAPSKFLRELTKRLRVKHRIHITACHLRSAMNEKLRNLGKSIPVKELTKGMSKRDSLLTAVQLAETLYTARVRSPQVSLLLPALRLDKGKHSRQGSRDISFLHSSGQSKVPLNRIVQEARSGMSVRKSKFNTIAGRKAAGPGGGHWARSMSLEFHIEIEAPIKKILRRLRDRGIISRRRPWPIHVACLTNVSDSDIVNWSAGIAISPLSYYRCRDNLYQVRTIVDHQIRWSAIFTLAHKHKSSARNIIQKYSKDSNIVNKEGGKTLAEFPNCIELGKLGPERGLND